jgi:hypothetical protein
MITRLMHGLFYASLLTGALLLTGIREAVANCISVPTHERIFDMGDIIVTPESVGVRWVRAEAEWPRINISSSSTSPCSILFRPLKSTSLDIVRNVQIYPTNGDVGLSSNIGVVAYNTPSAVNLTVRPPRDTPTTINQVVNFGVGTSILIHYNNSEYVSSQPFFSGPFNVPFFFKWKALMASIYITDSYSKALPDIFLCYCVMKTQLSTCPQSHQVYFRA